MTSIASRLDLMSHLVRRDFTSHYRDCTLGVLWSLMHPLAQLLVLVFLFQRVIPLDIEAYPAFVFSALLPWSWFSTSVGSAGGLFVGSRDLVRQPSLALATLVVVNTLSNLLSFLASLPILLAFLAWYGQEPGASLLFLPVLMAIQGALIVGLGLAVATLNVFYRDVQHIVTVVLSLLFYMTPVFYRSRDVPERFRWIFGLNPMAALIEGYRDVFLRGTTPMAEGLLMAAAISAGVCAIGYRIYRIRGHDVVDAL
jgi:lipopolysaccharide transport system permease protein